jgi:hypothetical protein
MRGKKKADKATGAPTESAQSTGEAGASDSGEPGGPSSEQDESVGSAAAEGGPAEVTSAGAAVAGVKPVDGESPGEREPVGDRENWAVLVDPGWESESSEESPPAEALVGGWPLDAEGKPGKFEPNPHFAPSSEQVPTDPTDAVLRLLAKREVEVDELIPTLRDGVLQLAVSETGHIMVGPAPDDAACVAVVTSPLHQARTGIEHWAPITADELADVVPPETDILLNPGGPAPMRLLTTALRDAIAASPDNTPDTEAVPDTDG